VELDEVCDVYHTNYEKTVRHLGVECLIGIVLDN
jgi:hypothetical protein